MLGSKNWIVLCSDRKNNLSHKNQILKDKPSLGIVGAFLSTFFKSVTQNNYQARVQTELSNRFWNGLMKKGCEVSIYVRQAA